MISNIWYSTKKVLEVEGVDIECKKDLFPFLDVIESQTDVASKSTHYHNLDEWNDVIYDYIRSMLKKYKFKNGDVEANAKNPQASFWWAIYGLKGSIIYSPSLKTEVATHHASAFERNEALKAEVNCLIKELGLER